jgi:hypothetical protein
LENTTLSWPFGLENREEPAESRKQRAESREHRAESREHFAARILRISALVNN